MLLRFTVKKGGKIMDIKKFVSFDSMITPVIIKVIFWIGLIASAIFGLISIFSGLAIMFSGYGAGGEGFIVFIGGLATIVIGALLTRVYCELLIIFFKMHESLNKINEKLDHLDK